MKTTMELFRQYACVVRELFPALSDSDLLTATLALVSLALQAEATAGGNPE